MALMYYSVEMFPCAGGYFHYMCLDGAELGSNPWKQLHNKFNRSLLYVSASRYFKVSTSHINNPWSLILPNPFTFCTAMYSPMCCLVCTLAVKCKIFTTLVA
ncbi:hypothetical protein FKM82_004678 [Ascaphus truei]